MHNIHHKAVGFAFALLLCTVVLAAPVAMNPTHPDRYVVQKGDTLWDIASRFLLEPWRWPDIWQVNPQIVNPHLIYPGDELSLTYEDGRPLLTMQPGSGRNRFSPRIRATPLEEAIPAIPVDAVKQFLARPLVATRGQLATAPYVVGFVDEHLAGASGDGIYVRSIDPVTALRDYDVVRPGKPYIDPDTKEILAYEAEHVASARLDYPGDPAKLLLIRSEIETLIGDRLLPDTEETPLQAFHPKPPDQPVEGSIIGVLGGVTQIGQYQTVVLNRGAADGLQSGDVLKIMQGGYLARDRLQTKNPYMRPLEEAGMLMIYRTFDRVSFGLVMYATKPLHIKDKVVSPQI